MKNKTLFALFIFIASLGRYAHCMNNEKRIKKTVLIKGIEYTIEDFRSEAGNITYASTRIYLGFQQVGKIIYRIISVSPDKRVGCILTLKVDEEFRHRGIGEWLAVHAGRFFYKNNITDIDFEASPFGFVSKDKNAEMNRLVDYYLQIGKKYGISVSHNGIDDIETKMNAVLPSRL